MKSKMILFLSILIILLIYSSEISFMPHYKSRPDKWHLLIPMFGFFIVFLAQLIWSVIEKIKQKKDYSNIILITISMLLFATLNTPKGDSQIIGYVGLLIVSIVSIILHLNENKKELNIKSIPNK